MARMKRITQIFMSEEISGNRSFKTARNIEARLLHEDLSRAVIGAAMEVSTVIGPGLREKAYERALCIELTKRKLSVARQKAFDVIYDGQIVDTLVPDLIVDDLIVVDTKVVENLDASHEAQMLTYLQITNLRLAILLNFKHRKLTWKRIIR
jgi:GxxExxY protein